MAKRKMLCPFSNRPCRDCPVYRGRHYALCFSKSYRGYLGRPGEPALRAARPSFEAASKERIVVPTIPVRRPLELYSITPEQALKEPGSR
jgi:hypothetical protein